MTLLEKVGECVMYWIEKWWQKKGLVVWVANAGIWSPLLYPL